MEDSRPSYRFDRFTLEVQEHRLMSLEGEVYLRPKTFETLLFLVEHHGHLVTKGALFDSVWAGVAVTDNALTRCIKEIRKALGDDASNPRFLRTVPRVGYKFVAEVQEVVEQEAESCAKPSQTVAAADSDIDDVMFGRVTGVGGDETNAPMRVESNSSGRGRLGRRSIGFALALCAALTAVYLYVKLSDRDAALGFQARDWVLIADFENLTSLNGLDVALRVILERELSFSRHVNYVPTGRVVDTLRLMKLDPASSPLTEHVAQEVCLRDGGIRALISGSIQQVGGDFQIGLRLIDPSTGATALILVEDAGSEDEVLPALRRLVRQLREALGESIESIARSEADLEKVTTPSFAALELYSKGQRLYESASFTQAAAFFDQAIAVDPEFASGYMSRALNSNILGRDPRVDLKKAAELSDTVTERERLLILLTEAIFVHRDVIKAMQTSEILVREYPDDYHGRFFRSYLLLASNDWDGWLEHAEGTQRTRPNDATLHFWKGLVLLLSQGDSEAAFREARRVLDINPQFPAGFPHFAGPCRDWMRGDLVLSKEGYTRLLTSEMSKLGPIFQTGVRQFVSRFFFFANDTDMALKLLGTSEWMVPRPPDELIARHHRLELALVHEELGDFNLCQELLRDLADSTPGIFKIQSLGWLGVHLARNGESVEADAIREELESEESETPVGFFTPPVPGERARAKRAFGAQILGEIAISNGSFREGIEYFLKVVEIVPPRGSVFASVLKPRLYLAAKESLAQAYARVGELGASTAAYRDIIDHKVLVATTPAAGQIWLRAVRAIIPLLEKTGQSEEAEEYLGLLKLNSKEPMS